MSAPHHIAIALDLEGHLMLSRVSLRLFSPEPIA